MVNVTQPTDLPLSPSIRSLSTVEAFVQIEDTSYGVTTITRFNRAFTLNQTINGFFESKGHNSRGSASRLSA
jgi:hypothetical protein